MSFTFDLAPLYTHRNQLKPGFIIIVFIFVAVVFVFEASELGLAAAAAVFGHQQQQKQNRSSTSLVHANWLLLLLVGGSYSQWRRRLRQSPASFHSHLNISSNRLITFILFS
ncbi:hypothetical protein TYRP_006823 [Tyrophagus putrescentiae]|nr:hypothetical protein TYRP_006823 [Tyrophagus putrescentiae]